MEAVMFRPRRLGHVNLYVGQLERSIEFYQHVCGIELVRLEPGIRGGFHSNGNTHHDIGMIEVSKGVDRVGRDGKVQIPATRGVRPGLNHLGWEMENEAQLVEAYRRMRAAGLSPLRLADHLISHSVYIADPDNNVHEFYADSIPDWRQIFNLDHEDLVTAEWDPLVQPSSGSKYYPVDPPIRHVPGAPLEPISITGVTIATTQFEAMKRFMTEVAGLECVDLHGSRPRKARFSGGVGRPDMTLVEAATGQATGLRLFSFAVEPRMDFDATIRKLAALGVAHPMVIDDERRRALVLSDPDNFQVEFYLSESDREPRAA
jgi:catechol 2,3-dioxygenase